MNIKWKDIQEVVLEFKKEKFQEQGFHKFDKAGIYELSDKLFKNIPEKPFGALKNKNKFWFVYFDWDDENGEYILTISNGDLYGDQIELKNMKQIKKVDELTEEDIYFMRLDVSPEFEDL